MRKKYAIGIDFGSLSGRAVVADLSDGRLAGQSVMNYPHGVMDKALPDGTPLGKDWALQHPQDYLDVLYSVVPAAVKESGVDPADIVGIGVDFTACTVLPVTGDGTPLCFLPGYAANPHAYVKLWKHHAAQPEADELNRIAGARGEKFLARYGGKISSEWAVPKVMQLVREAPDVYDAMAAFMEAADWIVLQMTNVWTRNTCTAGYKCLWNKRDGYPSDDFFAALDPKLRHFTSEKLKGAILPVGRRAGYLTPEAARRLGLTERVAVAVGNVDAHVALPAVGVTEPGKMLMIMGTSTCDILLGDSERPVPGICGVVEDGVIEGYFGYESGQSCVGDHFDWFVHNCVPAAYAAEAEARGVSIHTLLSEKAAGLTIGGSGLVALDWWNGNRSVLVDAELSGLMLGMTLSTRPEEMYRALIEATAFGKKVILDAYEEAGVPIRSLYACGGISHKNELMMQIYADVTGREIGVSACDQTPALGAAMFGAVAAGAEAGGFGSIREAAALGRIGRTYRPVKENVAAYAKLYDEYKILHDYFGRESDMMKRLRALREARGCWKS